MIKVGTILSKLPRYRGEYELLSEEQSVDDIIRGVKKWHRLFTKDYDKIYQYFIGKTPEKTCEKIFDFLRNSSFYYIEDEMTQTVRNPGAILDTGNTEGIDCKNYSLFIGGILDAVNRSGKQRIPFVYRFVSDSMLDPTPNHVFIVAYPGTDHEIFIDPVPQVKYFNERLPYYYHTDKNFSTMSLYGLSGYQGNKQIAGTAGDLIDAFVPIPGAGQIFDAVFGGILQGSQSNPNDWQGWDALDARYGAPAGTEAIRWLTEDGDDPRNEALNVLQYMKYRGWQNVINVQNPHLPGRIATWQTVLKKLTAAGYGAEAQALIQSAGQGFGSYHTGELYGNPAGTNWGKIALYVGGGALVAKLLKWW